MSDRTPIWEGLSPEEHEYQYNPQRSVPDFAAAQAWRASLSAIVVQKFSRHVDVAYGPGALHKVDIYPGSGEGPRPVHVFFHGGYWRAQDKQNFAYLAGELAPRGITSVIANYDL